MRHPLNKIDNPMYRKWLQDDEEIIRVFGSSWDGWQCVTPANARKFHIPVDAYHRMLAVQAGMKYYSQKLVQVYRSAGLDQSDFKPELLSDFLTEIGLNTRFLIVFLAPMDTATQFQLRHKFFGVPSFSLSCEATSILSGQSLYKLWVRKNVLNATSPFFQKTRFLRVEMQLTSSLTDDGTQKRAGIISVPPLVFATLDFAREEDELNYRFSSDYISEEIALRYLDIDVALDRRNSRHQDRFPGRPYWSELRPRSPRS